MFGIINLKHIDTTPGAGNAFAPPVGFDGNYGQFMFDRYQQDPGARQQIFIVARRLMGSSGLETSITGPFERTAKEICRRLIAREKEN